VLTFKVKFSITKRAETISYGSLRAKFYNVESGTRESVKNMLLTMVRHIEKGQRMSGQVNHRVEKCIWIARM
jgi:hypothetical protein